MDKTWKPMTAGILDIIAGVMGIIASFILILIGSICGIIPDVPQWIIAVLICIGIPIGLAGILAVVGGIYALKRKNWPLALTGAIAALFCSRLLGVLSIIFTAMGKNEFS
ncbi:MAG: hypothetical protein PHO26_04495 [Dehalococcoidia bacterium]|nr:hypothetical protein [Dehalococcoidia bacterium]MDD5493313.1 hypothetical protein [Dehalococcoidia bacterium]